MRLQVMEHYDLVQIRTFGIVDTDWRVQKFKVILRDEKIDENAWIGPTVWKDYDIPLHLMYSAAIVADMDRMKVLKNRFDMPERMIWDLFKNAYTSGPLFPKIKR